MLPQTERQKMLAGVTYTCLDADLEADREAAKRLLRRYNGAEGASERRTILEDLLGGIGADSIVEPPFYCAYGRNTYLGHHVFLNVLCTILDCAEVRIGDHVMLGPCVQLYTAAHHLQAASRIRGLEVARPIVIGDEAWLGGGAIVLPGVTIGRRAVVGAGAVVTRDVPPDTIVAGNPARVIREIDQG
jgi:maltose O-acetyltransferase